MKVGVIGIGFMGRGMARNVIISKAAVPGVSTQIEQEISILKNKLFIYDADKDKISSFMDSLTPKSRCLVHPCSSPADVASQADYIALSLPSAQVADKVLFGDDSICSHMTQNNHDPRQLYLMEHGTFSRDFVLSCYHRLLPFKQIKYIDAPVSGGPQVIDLDTKFHD